VKRLRRRLRPGLGGALLLTAGCALVPGLSLGDTAPPASPAERQAPPQFLPVTARWCLDGGRGCIDLEVPSTPRQFALGLQRRPPLPPLRGMWFPFSPPEPARFWMHQTPEALDMIFVRDGAVVHIEAAVPPCPRLPCRSYGAGRPVDGVVELAAGQAAALGIAAGTPVRIEPIAAGRPLSPAGPSAPPPD
jgi:uncharacterized membrane protein (UPF0127 family)